MLHLIPPPAHRVALRLANVLRGQWWRLRRPLLRGCRVVVLDRHGRVLLVRHSYGNRSWLLPGGGIGGHEDPVDAAAREVAEETGCRLAEPRLLVVMEHRLSGATNLVHVVFGRTYDAPRADNREIVAAAFFAPDALPEPMSPLHAERVREWITAAVAEAAADQDAAQPHRPVPTG